MDTRNQHNTNNTEKTTPMNAEQEIKNHRAAATELESAAKHHLNAAKHYEAGENDKAVACGTKAQDCVTKATNGTQNTRK